VIELVRHRHRIAIAFSRPVDPSGLFEPRRIAKNNKNMRWICEK
jgi:hypothetical protein